MGPWCLNDTGLTLSLEPPSVESFDMGVSGSSTSQGFLPDGPHHVPMVHKQLAQECSPLLNDPLHACTQRKLHHTMMQTQDVLSEQLLKQTV